MQAQFFPEEWGGFLDEGNGMPSEASQLDQLTKVSDAARLETFTARWQGVQVALRAYLLSFLRERDLLEDCLQEVALVAWEKAPLEKAEDAFLAHCLSCARFIALAASRKKRRSLLTFLPPDLMNLLSETVIRQEIEEPSRDRVVALRLCLSKLDAPQQRLLGLRYERGANENLKEEARREGKSLDALYKKLERLRGLLRSCVDLQLRRDP